MRSIRLPVVLVLAGVLSSGCKSTSAPPTPVPTSVSVSVTSVELAALGATTTVTATVKDQDGATMSGQAITWASTNASVATVSGAGTGTITAVANGTTTVTAASGSLSAQVTVNVTQVTTQLAKISGDGQVGTVASVAQPLVVEQRDARGNPVPGGTGGLAANTVINFAVASGGGSLSATAVTVAADGRASASWTLGNTAGVQTVTATAGVATAGTVTFSATAAAGAAAALVIVSGDDQVGTVGFALTSALVVRVDDQFGNPVTGHQVSFSTTSGGSLNPATASTGADGQASSVWTLGATPGAQTAQAQAQAAITGSPAVFDATATNLAITAVAPDTMVESSSVTVTGTGFDAVPGNNTVTIDGAAAAVTVASATSLTVTVPAFNCRPIRAVNVQVAVGSGFSNTVSHPLKPTGVLSLGVGEQQLVRDPAQFCLQFAASAAGGDAYLVGVGAAAEVPGSTMPFTLTSVVGASAAPPASFSAVAPRAGGVGSGFVEPQDDSWARHYRAEARLRAWERAVLPTLGPALPDRRASFTPGVLGAPRSPRAVGDTVDFRIPDVSGNPCTSYKTVKTVVQVVGTAGIWHRDITNPGPDSLTTAEIQAYSDTFDLHVYARDTLYFGSPSDIDANAKVEIVLSIEVNKFPLGIAGFVYAGDLFSRSVCPSSDSSEVFYGHVPDPGNVAGTGAWSKASVTNQMPSLIAHEFAHNIQFSRRLIVLGGTATMSLWEMEGQAMLAQEIVGHSILGNTPGQNYTSTTALQGQGNRWYGLGFRLLATYFGQLGAGKAAGAPELCTLFGSVSLSTPCDPFHFYGASWSFQRYVADRFRATYAGGETQLHRDLVSKFPNAQGSANWENVLGVSFDTLQARWAGMLYADDRVTGLAPAVGMSSWNMLEIFTSFPNDNYRLIPVARQFTVFSDSRSVRGGSTAYTTVGSVGARPALAVRVRDASDAVLAGTMEPVVWILRTQ